MEQSPAHFACPPAPTCHIADEAPDDQAPDDDEYEWFVSGEEPEMNRHVLQILHDECCDHPGERDDPDEAGHVAVGAGASLLLGGFFGRDRRLARHVRAPRGSRSRA